MSAAMASASSTRRELAMPIPSISAILLSAHRAASSSTMSMAAVDCAENSLLSCKRFSTRPRQGIPRALQSQAGPALFQQSALATLSLSARAVSLIPAFLCERKSRAYLDGVVIPPSPNLIIYPRPSIDGGGNGFLICSLLTPIRIVESVFDRLWHLFSPYHCCSPLRMRTARQTEAFPPPF